MGRPASSADRDGESLKRRIEDLERQLADSQDQAQRQEDRLDLYQALIDNAPFDISFKDLNGTYLLTNRAFDTNLQKSKDAIIGKTLTQLIGPEKAAPILALDRQALEARTGVSAEVPSLVVDSLQNYWSTKFPIENDQGEVVGVGSILADISKTKRLEERAVWAHQQLVDALEALTDGLAIFDADERLVVCNSRYKDLQSPVNDIMVPGAKFEDLLRDTVDRNQLAAAVDRGEAWVQERLCSFRNPGEPIELEFHDGTWMRLYERKTAEGGTVGVRIDITELKRRERQLRESEQILRDAHDKLEDRVRERTAELHLVTDNLPVLIVRIDADLRYRFANTTSERWFARPAAEIIGSKVEDVVGPDTFASLQPAFDAVFRGEKAQFELRLTHFDGITRDIEATYYPQVEEDGSVSGFFALIIDVTERKLAEAAGQQFLGAIDNLSEGLVLFDADEGLVMCNDQYRSIVGGDPAAIVPGATIEDLLRAMIGRGDVREADDDPEGWLARKMETYRGPIGKQPAYEAERGGRYYLVNELKLPDGSMVISYTDISESRQQKAQLHQAQKMEAIGQLTGGIAHDFNNLLAIMMGNLALLQDDVGADSEQNDLIEPTMQAVEQAAVLTSRMLAFSRQQPLEILRANANDLLRGMQSLINRGLAEEIEIAYDLAADLHDCFADPSQLEQAILNLSINARDAMPHGGLLRIATANRSILPGTNEALKVPPGDYVELTVADVGVGIAPDNLDRIFDPFFTTKDVGKGTGLGLSMVFGFIKQSEGHITVDSVQGEGTTFCLYLSAAQREEAPVQVVAMEETEGPANNEVILVVEDDGDVLAMVARVLEKNGYRVLRAGNGSDGLALLSAHPEIDMVLSDVLLPGGMNGQQMADAALAEHSDLKILFMSGYSREAIVEQGRLMPGVRLLGKPFNPNVLMQRVRESLGG